MATGPAVIKGCFNFCFFAALVVLLDHICNLSICVGGWPSESQTWRHTTIFKANISPLTVSDFKFLTESDDRDVPFLSSMHLFMWWPVLSTLFVYCLFICLETSVIHHWEVIACLPFLCWRVCLCLALLMPFFVSLAHIQHAYLLVLGERMLPPCFLQLTVSTCQLIPKFIHNGSRGVQTAGSGSPQ